MEHLFNSLQKKWKVMYENTTKVGLCRRNSKMYVTTL